MKRQTKKVETKAENIPRSGDGQYFESKLTDSTNLSKTSGLSGEAALGKRKLKTAKKRFFPTRTTPTLPKQNYPKLPSAYEIFVRSTKVNRKVLPTMVGMTAIYAIGVFLTVRGLSAVQDFMSLRALLESVLGKNSENFQSLLTQLTFLFGSSAGGASAVAGVYQSILLVLCSLALIWVLRQAYAGRNVGVKEAFYNGMYPLIPFLLVLLVLGIQLVPMTVGSYIYSVMIGGGIAVYPTEKVLSFAQFFVLGLWSLRMVTATIMALYIVTLEGMEPIAAIRSAQRLVQGRRLLVWRKYLFVPMFIFIGTSLAILPFLVLIPSLAVWVFFILSSVWFVLIHGYLYALYRELLHEV